MMFRAVFWVVHFTRQYNPEDSSEHNYYISYGCLDFHNESCETVVSPVPFVMSQHLVKITVS
jgi:hypothetical protein